MFRRVFLLSVATCFALTQFACQETPPPAAPAPTPPAAVAATPTPTAAASIAAIPGLKMMPMGLQYKDIVVGTGQRPRFGQTVVIRYEGKTLDGKPFDKGKDDFKLGDPGLLKGWNIGVLGNGAMDAMKIGGKRYIVIPPNLAYGDIGVPGKIPPNASISFEMELLDVK